MNELNLEYRETISGTERSVKLHLPPELILEIGYRGGLVNSDAMVAWYYHAEDDKAVLSDPEIDRSSLEAITATPLHEFEATDIADDDIDPDDIGGSRTTIPTSLPESVYTPLSQSDTAVLKPIPGELGSELQSSCVSVYPRVEYDQGDLPNVTRIDKTGSTVSENARTVGIEYTHANSV